MATAFSERIKQIIKSIPKGKVATYGQIAAFAGSPRAARHVVRILHACTARDNLPWHRVVNGQGGISLKPGHGYEVQKQLLKKEGIRFALDGSIDLDEYQWRPE